MAPSTTTEREVRMRPTPTPVVRFQAADGSPHTVAVRAVEQGWEVVDQNGAQPEVIDTLTHPEDGREQAEAVARDYAEWASLPTWARQ